MFLLCLEVAVTLSSPAKTVWLAKGMLTFFMLLFFLILTLVFTEC